MDNETTRLVSRIMEQDRTEIKVLDNGFVRLAGVRADDISVENLPLSP